MYCYSIIIFIINICTRTSSTYDYKRVMFFGHTELYYI